MIIVVPSSDRLTAWSSTLGPKREKEEKSADADGGPRSRVRTAGHSAQPPIDTSGNFSEHVSQSNFENFPKKA